MKRYQGEEWKKYVQSAANLEILQYTISLNNNICLFLKDANDSETVMHWLSNKEKIKFFENEKINNTKKVQTKDNKTFYKYEPHLLFNDIFNYKK